MHPYLFELTIGGTTLRPPTYGVLLALAFTLAYIESIRRALKLDEEPRHVENLFILIVLSSVIGARGFHVLFEEPSYYWAHPGKIFAIWEGGYTLYGAMLSSIFAIVVYCRFKSIEVRQFIDIAAPATLLGIAVGRVGCFMAGCCWGAQCDLPWAVTFTHPDAFTAVKNVAVHPAQLYEAFGSFLGYLYLLWLFGRRKYAGQITYHGLIFYSLVRFLSEFFRGDDYRGYLFGGYISYSQFISLLIIPFAVGGILLYSKKKDTSTS